MGNLSRAELRNINKTRGLRLSLFSFSETDDAFGANKPSVCPKQMVCFPLTDGSFCLGNSCFALAILSFSLAVPHEYKKRGEAFASPLYCICPEPKSRLRLQIYYIETPKSSIRAFFMTIPERISYSPGAICEP